ncbi:MAG: hypothetical protein OHK0045_02160 [Raineya sp.]
MKYYNSDCPVCQSLEILFEDKSLSNFYNQNFVSYALNTKNMLEEDKKFLQEANLHFTSVPFLLFFDAEKKFLHYSHIQQNTQFLLEIAQNALNPSEQTINLANKYKAGDRSIKTLYAYNNFLQVQKQDDWARVVAKDLFEVFPKNELASKKSFIITRDCVTDIDNGFFEFWINNMEKAAPFYTIEKVKAVLGEIVSKSIYYPNRPLWSLEKISKVKSYILLTDLSQNPDNFLWQEECRVLVEQKKEKEALALGKKIFDMESEIPAKLFTLQYLAELCKEKNSLHNIQNWLKNLPVQQDAPQDQADYYYIELLCLQKSGKKQAFEKLYPDAKKYYQKHQIDSQNIDTLKYKQKRP